MSDATKRDAWGLKCTCEARNRFATLHNSRCDLFQKLPADGLRTVTDRATEK
ncbi:hypothetical protein [Streptomyces platensis]|uniref:hypothetical protein n=1 Tax=Streptomyces platensis TaxID=58346 RepID=UPI003319880C